MRYVDDIATTEHYKISLYTWNGKYIVKVEAGLYEQIYKISEMDFLGDETDVRKIFSNESFLKTVFLRFQQMHDDFETVQDLMLQQ